MLGEWWVWSIYRCDLREKRWHFMKDSMFRVLSIFFGRGKCRYSVSQEVWKGNHFSKREQCLQAQDREAIPQNHQPKSERSWNDKEKPTQLTVRPQNMHEKRLKRTLIFNHSTVIFPWKEKWKCYLLISTQLTEVGLLTGQVLRFMVYWFTFGIGKNWRIFPIWNVHKNMFMSKHGGVLKISCWIFHSNGGGSRVLHLGQHSWNLTIILRWIIHTSTRSLDFFKISFAEDFFWLWAANFFFFQLFADTSDYLCHQKVQV